MASRARTAADRRPRRQGHGQRLPEVNRHRDERRADIRRSWRQAPARPGFRDHGRNDQRDPAQRVAGSRLPAYTRQLRQIDPRNPQNFDTEAYSKVEALREARDPVSGIAVGDLDGNGEQSIIATTTSGWIYVWSASGKLRDGFPVHGDDQYNTLPVPTPDSGCRRCRLPIRGNWSAPALGNLEGNGKLSILMSSYDGHVYAFRANGDPVPGWPVEVELPQSMKDKIPANSYFRDPKLMMTPAVGDVLGTGKDQVFLPSFECDDAGNRTFAYGIQSNGNNNPGGAYMPGWPVKLGAIGGCYSQSIDFVQEGANAASIADVDGSERLQGGDHPDRGRSDNPERRRQHLQGNESGLPLRGLQRIPALLRTGCANCRCNQPVRLRRPKR